MINHAVVGDHFTKLGDVQSTQTTKPASQTMDMCVRSSSDPSQETSEDEEKMQRLLAKPEVRDALLDADIQRLLEMLRKNPDAAQRWVSWRGISPKKIANAVTCNRNSAVGKLF